MIWYFKFFFQYFTLRKSVYDLFRNGTWKSSKDTELKSSFFIPLYTKRLVYPLLSPPELSSYWQNDTERSSGLFQITATYSVHLQLLPEYTCHSFSWRWWHNSTRTSRRLEMVTEGYIDASQTKLTQLIQISIQTSRLVSETVRTSNSNTRVSPQLSGAGVIWNCWKSTL